MKNFKKTILIALTLFIFMTSDILANTEITLWTYPGIPNTDVKKDIELTGAKTVNQEFLSLSNSGILKDAYNYSDSEIEELKKIAPNVYTTISGNITGMRNLFLSGMDINKNGKLKHFINTAVTFTTENNLTGIDIDFEKFGEWTQKDWNDYKEFLKILGGRLHQNSKKLQIDGPAITGQRYQNYFKWKYEELPEKFIDRIAVMVYDEMYDNGGKNPVASLDFVKNTAEWTKNKISDDSKIVLGLSAYGFQTVGGNIWKIKVLTKEQVFEKNHPKEVAYTRDISGEWHYFDGRDHFWYSDAESIERKKAVVKAAGIHKISFWHAGGGNFQTKFENKFKKGQKVLENKNQKKPEYKIQSGSYNNVILKTAEKGIRNVRVEIYNQSYKHIKSESKKLEIKNGKIDFLFNDSKLNIGEDYIIEFYIDNVYIKNFTKKIKGKRKVEEETKEKMVAKKTVLKKCESIEKLTQNLRAPQKNQKYIRDGKYDSYTKAIVKEAHILQKYLNKLGFSAGKVDGIIGPKTRSAIFKMQKFMGTKQDGYVGPKTRKLLNSYDYCKK